MSDSMNDPNYSIITPKFGDVLGFNGKYRFLSNFWPSNVLKPTLEHHYQAYKSNDPVAELEVMDGRSMSAGQAKRYGRIIHIRPDWDEVKDEVMLLLVRQKFTEPHLGRQLLATGDARLIEVNTWGDQYWGMVNVHGELIGRNQLGITLMQVRDEIRQLQ